MARSLRAIFLDLLCWNQGSGRRQRPAERKHEASCLADLVRAFDTPSSSCQKKLTFIRSAQRRRPFIPNRERSARAHAADPHPTRQGGKIPTNFAPPRRILAPPRRAVLFSIVCHSCPVPSASCGTRLAPPPPALPVLWQLRTCSTDVLEKKQGQLPRHTPPDPVPHSSPNPRDLAKKKVSFVTASSTPFIPEAIVIFLSVRYGESEVFMQATPSDVGLHLLHPWRGRSHRWKPREAE